MRLPHALEPWRAWLALFPPDLAEPVGELLLRLHALVGNLNTHTMRADDRSAGIGDIVRRGQYERLLLSEWVYADAEPEEFLRRAAAGEQLFAGPERGDARRSRQCLAIFDAGPWQFGAPRLAHLALFILIARRAEEAGARFCWGVMQKPGVLHEETGRQGLRKLLAARTAFAIDTEHAEAWNDFIVASGQEWHDCWQVGGRQLLAMSKATAQVRIEHDFAADTLAVRLRQRHASRDVVLVLPQQPICVRLLREPFAAVATPRIRLTSGRPSLKQPPRFSVAGPWLAVPQLEGGAVIFNVPQSPNDGQSKYRVQAPLKTGSILAAGVFRKNLSYVVSEGDSLTFHGFPGEILSQHHAVCERPDIKAFRAPVGLGRWLPVFFLSAPKNRQRRERILILDIERQLVCWEYSMQADRAPVTAKEIRQRTPDLQFKQVADNVIGAEQFDKGLVYARLEDGGIQLYRWYGYEDQPAKTVRLPVAGNRVLFGIDVFRHASMGHGAIAVQRSKTEWWVGDQGEAGTVELHEGATVLGVARSIWNPVHRVGLVVLLPDRKTIQFRTRHDRHDIVQAAGAIAQAAFDARTGKLAWLMQGTHELFVRGLGDDRPLLQAVIEGEHYAR